MRSFKAKALFDNPMDWMSEYGQITELYFDAGSNFCSRLFTILLEGLGVRWKNAPKGSHDTVGIVKRQVQEINQSHRKHIGALKEWWKRTFFIEKFINNTPRKIVSWKTPYQQWTLYKEPEETNQINVLKDVHWAEPIL